jgi:UDP-N-acetylmuramoyl-tripeptide--D-alanyl-D-alanine ligase
MQVRAGEQHSELNLHLPGEHNGWNALAAIAVGVEAGVPLAECCAALERCGPRKSAGQVLTVRGATLINDAYNSNPEALKSMIAMLAGMPARRRILIAGEMLELGPEADALHTACGKAAAQAGVNIVVGVRGKRSAHRTDAAREAGAEALFLETPEAAGQWLREHLEPGDAVLLKASRGVRLERALDGLRQRTKKAVRTAGRDKIAGNPTEGRRKFALLAALPEALPLFQSLSHLPVSDVSHGLCFADGAADHAHHRARM